MPKVIYDSKPRYFSSVECLASNIYWESRAEPLKGMQAVAAVTYNRLKHKNYPADMCSVVFQSKQFSWTHRISFDRIQAVLKGDLSKESKQDQEKYLVAWFVANTAQEELTKVLPRGTLHFHSVQVLPKWSQAKVRVAQIGRHVFYKDKS